MKYIQNKQPRIIFFGSSKFVIPIIEVLAKNFDLALVVTTEIALQGETLRGYPVVGYCMQNKIPYLSVQQFNNLTIRELKKFNPPIGILASFGAIIPKAVLEVFKYGILNIHPSLLPKYRGPTPVQTSILNGETKTGITIIKLDEEVDHGPILARVEEPILENDTSESLYERLFQIGASSTVSTIELYVKGKITLREQDHSKATFTKRLTREDGFIDISKIKNQPFDSAQGKKSKIEIDRMIRAYHPWPGVWTKYQISNIKYQIVKFLPGRKIQVEGKKPMSYKDFINGYPKIGKEILTKLELV